MKLKPRELDVLRELVRGDGGTIDKEIAFRLGLSHATVKVYMARVMSKLKMPGRTALALYVERSGMFRGE